MTEPATDPGVKRKAIAIAVAMVALLAAVVVAIVLRPDNGGGAPGTTGELAERSISESLAEGDLAGAAAGAADALRELLGRSPGERGAVMALSKGKGSPGPVRLAYRPDRGAGEEPQQRALGQVFDPEPVLEDLPPADQVLFAPPEQTAGIPEVLAGPLALAGTGDDFTPIAGGGSYFPSPGAVVPIGPGFGGNVPNPNPTDPPPVTPIPEPATWAMMLIGFGLCGYAMRRRTTRLVGPAHGL